MCEEGGADVIHLDVMDGRFVPNITFGEKMIATGASGDVASARRAHDGARARDYFESFAGAGATGMTIHVEAAPHLQRQLVRIRELGCVAGAAVNPGTSLDASGEVIADLDLLLIMTVNPGFGGQKFIRFLHRTKWRGHGDCWTKTIAAPRSRSMAEFHAIRLRRCGGLVLTRS